MSTAPTSLARVVTAVHDHAPNEATEREADAVVLDEWRKVQRSQEFRVQQAGDRLGSSREISHEAEAALRVLAICRQGVGRSATRTVDEWLEVESLVSRLLVSMRRDAADHRAMASQLRLHRPVGHGRVGELVDGSKRTAKAPA